MFMVYFSWQRAMQFELFLSRRRKRAHPIQARKPGDHDPVLDTEAVKLYTLFKTEDSENHTLSSGTPTPRIANIGEYPPPPGLA